MQGYRASGKVSAPGLIAGLVVAVVTGTILGLISFAVQYFLIYLVPVHAIIAAALVFAIAGLTAKAARLRNIPLAAVYGMLVGLITFGVSWGGQYAYSVYEISQERSGKETDLVANWQQAQLEVDSMLRRITDQTGALGYVLFTADEGMTISRVSSSGTGGIELDRTTTLIYYGVEILLAVGAGLFGAVGAASQPFNEQAQRWMKEDDYRFFGSVGSADVSAFNAALARGSYAEAGQRMTTALLPGALRVSAVRLGDLPTDDVLLRTIEPVGTKKQVRTQYGVLTAGEFQQLVRTVQGSAQPTSSFGSGMTNFPLSGSSPF